MFDINALDQIDDGTLLSSLNQKKLTAVQRALAINAYPVGKVDGRHGPKTRNAFAEFVVDHSHGDTSVVTEYIVETLKALAAKLGSILNGSADTQDQVKDRISDVFEFVGLCQKEQIAYGMATAQWETAHTFKPSL